MKLENKVAVVTGGAKGIGEGIAKCLVDEGARVVLIDLDGPGAEATALKLGADNLGIAGDCSEESEMTKAADQVFEHYGRFDILVNNAGGGRDAASTAIGNPFTNISQEAWDGQLATNLRTTYAATKAAIPHLKNQGEGAIVNIASIAAMMASSMLPAYAAAKAGVVSLTRTLALELAPDNIRVNVICPGLLYTRVWEMLAQIIKDDNPRLADMSIRDVFLGQVQRAVPLGREQTPEDIGKLTAFLCSPDAQNITGQSIAVDGGITLRGT